MGWLGTNPFRVQIVLGSSTSISGTIYDYPAIVFCALSAVGEGASSLSANIHASGWDVAFTSDDGTTVLDHEFEYFHKSANQRYSNLIAYVRFPVFNDTSNTAYMYFGDTSMAASKENPTGVWRNYQTVLHFNNPANTPIPDSAGKRVLTEQVMAGTVTTYAVSASHFDVFADVGATSLGSYLSDDSAGATNWVDIPNTSYPAMTVTSSGWPWYHSATGYAVRPHISSPAFGEYTITANKWQSGKGNLHAALSSISSVAFTSVTAGLFQAVHNGSTISIDRGMSAGTNAGWSGIATAYTLAFWFKLVVTAGDYGFFTKSTGNYGAWVPPYAHLNVKMQNNVIYIGNATGSNTNISMSYTIGNNPLNTWRHFATAWSTTGGQRRIYLDGVSVTSAPNNQPLSSRGVANIGLTGLFLLGKINYSVQWQALSGAMDDVVLFDYEMSDSELKSLTTQPFATQSFTGSDRLQLWYSFEPETWTRFSPTTSVAYYSIELWRKRAMFVPTATERIFQSGIGAGMEFINAAVNTTEVIRLYNYAPANLGPDAVIAAAGVDPWWSYYGFSMSGSTSADSNCASIGSALLTYNGLLTGNAQANGTVRWLTTNPYMKLGSIDSTLDLAEMFGELRIYDGFRTSGYYRTQYSNTTAVRTFTSLGTVEGTVFAPTFAAQGLVLWLAGD